MPKSGLTVIAAVLFTLATAACVGVQKLVVSGSGFDLKAGIAYGPDPRQTLDIYTPRESAPKGTVLFIYGGSWTGGEKALYRFMGQALTEKGYQAVVADYRVYPAVRYPAFVEDTASAFAWVKANIAGYGGDPARIAVMGHSAGAYNVAMIALDPVWLAPHGATPADIKALVALAGPLSFNPLDTESTRDIFVTAPDIERARPIKLAARGAEGAPPMLLIHGTGDTTVGDHNSKNMAAAVNAAGGTATLKLYPDAGHLTVVTCFAWPLRGRAPCLEDATQFLDKALGVPSAPLKE